MVMTVLLGRSGAFACIASVGLFFVGFAAVPEAGRARPALLPRECAEVSSQPLVGGKANGSQEFIGAIPCVESASTGRKIMQSEATQHRHVGLRRQLAGRPHSIGPMLTELALMGLVRG